MSSRSNDIPGDTNFEEPIPTRTARPCGGVDGHLPPPQSLNVLPVLFQPRVLIREYVSKLIEVWSEYLLRIIQRTHRRAKPIVPPISVQSGQRLKQLEYR